MPYFVKPEDLGTGVPPVRRLFLELWVDTLESRMPMLLGPPPFSLFSLLEAIRYQLSDGSLRPATITSQIRIGHAGLRRRGWIRETYPGISQLQTALDPESPFTSSHLKKDAIAQLDDLFDYYRDKRVTSHLDFILGLKDSELALVAHEVRDFLSDLIALGHSESFLYGFGRAVLLAQDPALAKAPVEDRFLKLRELGRERHFDVCFKIQSGTFIPHSDVVSVNRKYAAAFTAMPPWTYTSKETAALVKVNAPDYKAAIEKALLTFSYHVRNLSFSRRLMRVIPRPDEFRVLCHEDGEQLSVKPDVLRPYEPPPLLQGNAIWLCKKSSPDLIPALERTLFWLASSRNCEGEAEFICLWLALVSLFGTDDVTIITPSLARYRLTVRVQILAQWIGDYLGKACRLEWSAIPESLAKRLRLRSTLVERLAPIVQTIWREPLLLEPLNAQSPLLALRASELSQLCSPPQRADMVQVVEAELETLLPGVQSLRHSIAHLGHASMTAIDLANHHLVEDITRVYDQVAASGLGAAVKSAREVHDETIKDFDQLIEAVLAEPCLEVLHVRQKLAHMSPLKHFWKDL